MFKENEFKAMLVRNNMTVTDLAKEMGITYTTLYRKIKNYNSFKLSDIRKLEEIFSPKEVKKVFFD